MKKINDILRNCVVTEVVGDNDRCVSALTFDSRKCADNVAFFALRGTQVDGHDFIDKAVGLGAKVVVCEKTPDVIYDDVTYYVVEDSAKALGYAASEFYDRPSEKLHLVGVTGTNGKTTIATLLYRLFFNAGYPCGLLSTIENRVNNLVVPSTHTTGDQLQINEMLSKMVDAGCEYAFMEVSSHAVAQDRIAGLHFAGGIFTNLTHDHLDYHKTVAAYRDAKKKFFDNLPASAFALTNIDDRNGMMMLQNTKAAKKTYSLRTDADFKGVVLESYFDGMELKINRNNVSTFLVGRFNVSNLLAIYGAASLLGMSDDDLLKEISNLHSAPGRFQMVHSNSGIVGIVDYAHTPDGLRQLLQNARAILPKKAQLFVVFGCGGDRDRSKRPIMGKIANQLADFVVLTSDNPRTEDPDKIIDEIEHGIITADTATLNNYLDENQVEKQKRHTRIVDRVEAIKFAVEQAQMGDMVVIAGKGHENYMEINHEKIPYMDSKVIDNILRG